MADLKAKAFDIADKLLAGLYFVVGAIIGIFTGVLSAIPQLPQLVEGLWAKAKEPKVAKSTGNAPLRAPLPPKALKVDHGSKENTAPNANGHANGHHSPE